MALLPVGLALSAVLCGAASGSDASRGYLHAPPVFLRDEHDVPLGTFGAPVLPRGQASLCSSSASPESDAFRSGGVDAQPRLKLTCLSVKGGLMRGLGSGWAVGFLAPYARTHVSNSIGGYPATGKADGPGELLLFAKRAVRRGSNGDLVIATAGVELPTGKDDYTFNENNAVTNAYYRNYPGRMPLGWQPSNGAVNGCFALGYLRHANRMSYEGLAACKVHGRGDEDVRLGSVLLFSANATYGISERSAFALGLVFRSQGNDSYPNAPPPGITQAALAGTTSHGSGLYLDPTIRVDVTRYITVGVGMRWSLVEQKDGMVPRSGAFLILYPHL